MKGKANSETAFETAIEEILLARGYQQHVSRDFDAELAIFPEVALAFIEQTQPKVWDKPKALHNEKTGERVISALCKWMDTHGVLTTLQVLRQDPADCVLQTRPRIESGTGSPLRIQYSRDYPPTPFQHQRCWARSWEPLRATELLLCRQNPNGQSRSSATPRRPQGALEGREPFIPQNRSIRYIIRLTCQSGAGRYRFSTQFPPYRGGISVFNEEKIHTN